MRASVLFSGAVLFVALTSCGPDNSGGILSTGGDRSAGGEPGGSGGATENGGTTGGGSGGATGSGGSTSSSTGSGGTTSGTAGKGGATSAGGQDGTGGASARGGNTGSGGTATSGGVTGSAGRTGSGGAPAGSGGSAARDAGSAGTSGSGRGGSTGGGGSTGPCTEANKTVTSGSGKYCGYTYENWVGTGSATMVLRPDGYSVNWTGSTEFVGRVGARPGSGDLVVDYNATFTPNGNSYLCVYGWTTNPLVEYYVVDGWGSWKPPGGTSLGTVTSDGGTYDIYKSTRTNQPSIQGTATFPQYWSVRQQKKTSGTITLANHITAWAGKSMPMGTFYEVSMTVEGYQSSGTADVKFTIK
jgi:endo-1,4-beta-xylanase